jgi:hypothetical protein
LSHTPGPWIEREDFDYYQGGEYLCAGPFYVYKKGEHVPLTIEDITDKGLKDFHGKNICRVESDEDKGLLAAAPDLYKALSELLAIIDEPLDWKEQILNARLAIQKANR